MVYFTQATPLSQTHIQGTFTGLEPGNKHGFHIHQYGNLLNGCVTAGAHYNPFGQTHGGPKSEVRHVGDLGNVPADEHGNGKVDYSDSYVRLHGPHSVVGRSCVLHKKTDDLGQGGDEESLKTGNAGPRIACGVIGVANY